MAIKKSSVSVDDIEDVVVKPKAKKVAPAPASSTVAKKATVAGAPAKRGFPAKKVGGPAKAAPARPPLPRFVAPSDFKPFFAQIDFRTGEDGLISPDAFEIIRFRGRWDNETARRYNMSEYDAPTTLAVASRLAAVTHGASMLRRLPANTAWSLIARVSKRALDDSLMFSIKAAKVTKEGDAEGKLRWYKDKTNLAYRKIRRVCRIMPSAFVNVQLPPSGRQKKTADEE